MMRSRAAALIAYLWLAVAHAAEPFPGSTSDHNGAAMCAVPIGTANAQVLVPATASSGHPWVLAASLYDLENPALVNLARTHHELVKQGFHVVAIEPGGILGAPDPEKSWDAVYREMTTRFGLSREVVLMGVGREGVPALRWAAANPGKVSCLYLDKAVCHEPQTTASTLNPGHEQKDPTYTVNFGVKLQERLRELNVPCDLLYPGAPDATHTSVSDYLIARLAVRQSSEPK